MPALNSNKCNTTKRKFSEEFYSDNNNGFNFPMSVKNCQPTDVRRSMDNTNLDLKYKIHSALVMV